MELLEGKQLKQAITQFRKQEARRDEKIHRLACSCLNHAGKHEDVSYLNTLMDSLGKASHPGHFRYWVGSMCPAIGYSQQKGFYKKKGKGSIADNLDLEKAINTPWWELDKVKEDKSKDWSPEKGTKKVESTLKRQAKEAREHGETELAEVFERMLREAEQARERLNVIRKQSQASVGKSARNAEEDEASH